MEDSLRISDQGLRIVEQARKRRGWNRQSLAWCRAALTSLASLKQFWRRRRIQKDSFIRICEAVGVQNWQEITDPEEQASGILDWGDAPEMIDLWGREQDLDQMQRWILKDRCRFLSLYGLPGVGKSALGVALVERLRPLFDRIVWRSTQRFSDLQALLRDLLHAFGDRQEDPQESEDLTGLLESLRDQLKQHRCLIVLDDWDPQRNNISDLISQIGQISHGSCLVTMGTERVNESLFPSHKQVRSHSLQGLSLEAASSFLETISPLQGSSMDRQYLIQHYGGHPLALRSAGSVIQDLFFGEISLFLEAIRQGGFPLSDLIPILERCISDLSETDQALLHQLALATDPLSIPELRHQIPDVPIRWQLPFILQTLQRRGLLQITPQGLRLLPMISEYWIYRWVNRLELEPEGELKLPPGRD